MIKLGMINRCGQCTACCNIFNITELKKPSGVDCIHLDKKGNCCSIYKSRPSVCVKFKCLWLDQWKGMEIVANNMGVGKEKLRPDELGLVLNIMTDPLFDGIIGVHRIDLEKELGNNGKRFLWELQKIVLYYYENVVYGPRKDVDKWVETHVKLD